MLWRLIAETGFETFVEDSTNLLYLENKVGALLTLKHRKLRSDGTGVFTEYEESDWKCKIELVDAHYSEAHEALPFEEVDDGK